MRTLISYPALTLVAGVVILVALAAWWGTGITPASAQPQNAPNMQDPPPTTPPPVLSPARPDQPTSKTSTFAMGTITTSYQTNLGGLAPPAENSGNGASAGRSGSTPIPTNQIANLSGYVAVTIDVTDDPSTEGLRLRLERRWLPENEEAFGETGGWMLLTENAPEGDIFDDYEVMVATSYRYRVTPVKENGDELKPWPHHDYFVRPSTYLHTASRPDGVTLHVTTSDLGPGVTQFIDIVRYDNVERTPTTGRRVIFRTQPPDLFATYKDLNVTKGRVYYYTMDLYQQLTPTSPIVKVDFNIQPLAVMAGITPPTAPGAPIVNKHVDGKTSVVWTLPVHHNRQALSYSVERKRIKPIGGGFKNVGVTTGVTLTNIEDAPAHHVFEYRVVPVTMDFRRGSNVSVTMADERLAEFSCKVLGNDSRGVIDLDIYKDLLGDPRQNTEVPRTFDLYPVSFKGEICVDYDLDRLYLERAIYYRNVEHNPCDSVAGTGCELMHLTPPDPSTLEVEQLWDVGNRPVRWGFPQWKITSFSDPKVPPGRFGMLYRVCAVPPVAHTSGILCSTWVDTGLHDSDGTPEVRTYPAAVTVYR